MSTRHRSAGVASRSDEGRKRRTAGRGLVGLRVFPLVLPCLGCLFDRPLSPADCRLAEPGRVVSAAEAESRRATRTPIDLSGLKLYRNTFLVDRVGPYEHHFSIWYVHIDANYARVRARIDPATGRVHIAVDDEEYGSVGTPEHAAHPTPPEVADLARALEREVRDRCPKGRNWVVQYEGQYREVRLGEMMRVLPGDVPPPTGWHGTFGFAADEALTRQVAGPTDYTSGLGSLSATEPVQWLDFVPPPESTGTTLFVARLERSQAPSSSAEAVLMERALDAARRFVAKEPSPRLSDVLAAQGETLLPPGIDQRLELGIGFDARPRPELHHVPQQDSGLTLELKTAEVVRGASRAEAVATIAGVGVKASAVLTKLRSLDVGPPGRTEVAALLQVHVEDDRGNVFDRSYPAAAMVVVDGDAAATLGGFRLSPGPGWPTAAQDEAQGIPTPRAFRGTLPGVGPFSIIELSVSTAITNDPRW